MLRKIRLTLAVLFFTFITLLFLDFTGTLHSWFGWMAKIQFLPAVLALNVGVILLLVVLTLVFGRVYCSVICPLGVFQDVVSWISGRRKKGKYRFTYSPDKNVLRYGVLALFVIALIAGIGSFVALLAPYSSYGRIASNLFAPIYGWGNNALAYLAERADSYAFYETSVWLKSLPTFIVAALTFIIISVLAWRNGRTYCNTVCPVGTVLGFLSRFSLLRVTIDKEKCNACGLCSRKCKAACIDGKNHTVDYSRCVACMDCIETCRHGAISFGLRRKKETVAKQPVNAGQIDDARRSFLTATAIVATAATVKAQEKKVDGGLAVIEDKKIPERATPIVPPGAWSARDFARHCTACQLCVSVCPNEVLRPSTDLMKLMQPEMSYERGYCRGMHEVRRCLPCRGDTSDNRSRKVRHADRPRRMGEGELCAADRRRGVRQLRPPLSDRSDTDGSVRPLGCRIAEDTRGEHGALHRLWGLREPLPGTSVQRDLCGRARSA